MAIAGADPTALVVMSTHGRSGISRCGRAVTDRVLHTTPNPMLIVRANVMGPASPETSLRTSWCRWTVRPCPSWRFPTPSAWPERFQPGITVLRITPTEGTTGSRSTWPRRRWARFPTSTLADPNELAAEDASEASAYLDDVRNRMRIDHAHGVATEHRVGDNIAQTIIERASVQPSLVVMTTHGRSGVGRMVLGSVTERVIRHSNLPVLVIR